MLLINEINVKHPKLYSNINLASSMKYPWCINANDLVQFLNKRKQFNRNDHDDYRQPTAN